MALKWGITSAALISHDFISSVKTLTEGDHVVVAVAAFDLGHAEEFAKNHGVSKAYGSYLELAKDPNFEVAYVVNTNRKHDVVMVMLEHGKHVLCEKPMSSNKKQLEKLIAFAKEKNLFLMEGISSRMFPSYQFIRNQIDVGNLGDVVSAELNFGNQSLQSFARIPKEDVSSEFSNMGMYAIQFCQWVFREPPKTIEATGKQLENDGDFEILVTLTYNDNKVGKIKMSAAFPSSCTAEISGTGNLIMISYPVWSSATVIACNGKEKSWTVIDVDGSTTKWPVPKSIRKLKYSDSYGLKLEAYEVRNCIRAGKIESELVTHNDSLLIAHIWDEIHQQITHVEK